MEQSIILANSNWLLAVDCVIQCEYFFNVSHESIWDLHIHFCNLVFQPLLSSLTSKDFSDAVKKCLRYAAERETSQGTQVM